jgi:hypothetical protein
MTDRAGQTEIIFRYEGISEVGASFLCYSLRGFEDPPLPRPQIQLVDQFQGTQAELGRPFHFCRQAQIGDQATAQELELVGYAIMTPKRIGADEPKNQWNSDHTMVGANALGTTSFRLRSRLPNQLRVPSGIEGVADDFFANHYQCYLVSAPQIIPFDVMVAEQDGAAASALRVSRLSRFCTPTNKNNEGTRDRITSLFCYNVTPRRSNDGQRSYVVYNQFGTNGLELSQTQELCVPSSHAVMSVVIEDNGDN